MVYRSFDDHFDESKLFKGDASMASTLKVSSLIVDILVYGSGASLARIGKVLNVRYMKSKFACLKPHVDMLSAV